MIRPTEERHINIDYIINDSSLKEYSIKENKMVWSYEAPYRFFSPQFGYSSPLPNGNVLASHITHGGSVFEVTKKGEIVFEWVNHWNEAEEAPYNVYFVQKVKKGLVQPFLENSFKHGAYETIDNGWLEVFLSISNNELIFKVENSIGIQAEKAFKQFEINFNSRRKP